MIKQIISKIITSLLLLISFSSFTYAADLEIICYENEKPLINKNTNPLFNTSTMLPGEIIEREIYIINKDPNNPCRIYLEGKGEQTKLGDQIRFVIKSNILDTTLSKFLNEKRILIAELKPETENTQTIYLELDRKIGNSFKNQTLTFDILIHTEWGKDGLGGVETGTVSGTTDIKKKTFLTTIAEALGIGGGDDISLDSNTEEEETSNIVDDGKNVLGEKDTDTCKERTLWWLPIVIQFLLTMAIVLVDKSILEYKSVKLLISVLLALLSYFIVEKIGCGCNAIWICTNHWILNTFIGLLPILSYLDRKDSQSSPYGVQ